MGDFVIKESTDNTRPGLNLELLKNHTLNSELIVN